MLWGWSKKKLLELFSLQPGQGTRTFLTAIYLCLVIASYVMLKSVAKAEYIQRFGADKIPWVTIATGVLVGVFVALYVSLARRTNPSSLIIGTQLLFISNLLLFWWLAIADVRWMYPVFYVWVSTYGIITATQVWILANYLFTTREGKRVFGVVGAGGILGGILGGFATGALAHVVGTGNLRLVAAGALTGACGLVVVLSRYRLPVTARKEEFGTPGQLLDSLRIVAASPHLRLVAGLVFTTALATKMVDWQFTKVAEIAFATEDARTAFFGVFEGFGGTVAFLFQVFLTSRLLLWMGLGGTILIFPAVLSVATLGTLVPAIAKWAAALLRASDVTLKHSIDRSSRELLYLPVSQTVKVQVKSAIDMMGDRLGDGVSGVVQLATLAVLGLFAVGETGKIGGMGLVNLVFLGLWLTLALRLRKSYVGELSRSIEEGRVRIESWHEALAGAEALRAVERALDSGKEDTVRAALDLLGRNPEWDLTPTLCRLAKDDSPDIRARALAILLRPDNPDLPEGVTDAFAEEDQTLLSEIVDLQLARDPEERERRAQAILARAGGSARGAWIALMVRRLGPEFRPVARGLLEELLRPTSPSSARQVAATGLGMIPVSAGVSDLLPPLLDDEDPRVASAAARSAASIGGSLLEKVVPLLGRNGTGAAAREALQSGGDDAVAVLQAAVDEGDLDRRSRMRVPAVLAGIESSSALRALIEMLRSMDEDVAQAAGEALYRIRLKKPEWALLPPREAKALILVQAQRCRRLARLLEVLEEDPDPPAGHGWRVLLSSLRAARDRCRSGIFRMLCLQFPPREILTAKRGLTTDARERRANAAELLDNLLPRGLSRELLPLLYEDEYGAGSRRAGGTSVSDVVLRLADGEDDWMRTCAITLAGERGGEDARQMVETSIDHANPLVRQEAIRALERMDGRPSAMNSMNVVDKVVALQGVEVFRGTPPDQLALIASVARQETFAEGSEICRQDDPPGDMFVLLGGKVRAERDGAEIGELGEGDALGTWGLFEDEPWKVSATAVEATPVLRIDRMGFEDALQENPEIARSLIQQLVRRLRELAR